MNDIPSSPQKAEYDNNIEILMQWFNKGVIGKEQFRIALNDLDLPEEMKTPYILRR
jgi:hypothetical protein